MGRHAFDFGLDKRGQGSLVSDALKGDKRKNKLVKGHASSLNADFYQLVGETGHCSFVKERGGDKPKTKIQCDECIHGCNHEIAAFQGSVSKREINVGVAGGLFDDKNKGLGPAMNDVDGRNDIESLIVECFDVKGFLFLEIMVFIE